jgi:UDP-4-amino-4,6-dideoxy-N-acetyl-beta-L-altrosamine transaminase
MINYGRQFIDEDDIEAVISSLKSDFLTTGPKVPEFENAVSDRVNSKYAVAVNSATSALHIACMAIGLEKGDILWTSPNTFAASSNCGLYCGASVDFVDIDVNTWNICHTKLKEKLEESKKDNSLPKVLIPVHFAGQPTIQEEIYKLSQEYGFKIIEDASHSIGSERNNEITGNCKWSDITVFSFHPVKMITTAEGGMALTNNKEYADKMNLFRSHGITRDEDMLNAKDLPKYYYEQQCLGYNYRMTDIHASLGISQLKKIDKFIETRNNIAARYNQELLELPISLPTIAEGNKSSYHLYVIKIQDDFAKVKPRDQIYKELIQEGIGVNLHYLPVHLHPYYKNLGFYKNQYPISENYADNALSIPIFYGLTNDQQSKVIQALKIIIK